MLHLGFNMLGLWFFGPGIEVVIGASGLLQLYLCGALGGFAGVWWQYRGNGRRYAIPPCIGASSATSAVFMYFVAGNPWQPILFWFIPMPAILAALIIFGMGTMGSVNSSISHSGHLGGALSGGLFYILKQGLFRF